MKVNMKKNNILKLYSHILLCVRTVFLKSVKNVINIRANTVDFNVNITFFVYTYSLYLKI